ncbi:hypothetical protein SAMN05444166_8018 [Singulisphaera sp. GP187]|nr:hypothetical protein SAMN05444166_8018 [Singulisphaera sp. GP187]
MGNSPSRALEIKTNPGVGRLPPRTRRTPLWVVKRSAQFRLVLSK